MSLTKQVISFGAIGILNTAIDIGSYAALITFGTPLIIAIFISTSLGLLSSYVLNRRLTFHASHTTATLVRFLAVTLAGLWVLQPLIIFGLSQAFSLHSVAALTTAKLAATAVTLVWNFCWYRLKIFV